MVGTWVGTLREALGRDAEPKQGVQDEPAGDDRDRRSAAETARGGDQRRRHDPRRAAESLEPAGEVVVLDRRDRPDAAERLVRVAPRLRNDAGAHRARRLLPCHETVWVATPEEYVMSFNPGNAERRFFDTSHIADHGAVAESRRVGRLPARVKENWAGACRPEFGALEGREKLRMKHFIRSQVCSSGGLETVIWVTIKKNGSPQRSGVLGSARVRPVKQMIERELCPSLPRKAEIQDSVRWHRPRPQPNRRCRLTVVETHFKKISSRPVLQPQGSRELARHDRRG